MRIATWNVNSITVRKERVLAFLSRHSPDVLCLQELKCLDDAFPMKELEQAGYHAVCWGQKTYNGVALLSKRPITDVTRGPCDTWQSQARFVGGRTYGMHVFSVYVPNGQSIGSDKFRQKLLFLDDLRKFLSGRFAPGAELVLGGDFNIAPESRDVHDPKEWLGKVLFSEAEKAALFRMKASIGLEDAYRSVNEERSQFTWWDYRAGAFERNLGLRIDLILTTRPVTDRVNGAEIDRLERRGDKPSDHAPVWIDLTDSDKRSERR